jgi:hypothetical protein
LQEIMLLALDALKSGTRFQNSWEGFGFLAHQCMGNSPLAIIKW